MALAQANARSASSAERRHDAVAEVFVERAVVGEDLAGGDAMDVAQEREHVVGRTAFGQFGKADNVGKHDGDVLAAAGAQGFVVIRELGHDVWREETREVAARAL